MPTITQRQEDILDAAVAEFIRTGAAVSSDDLRVRYRFKHSPATIRNELLSLSEGGYLSQPHTSAGRVPTDEGYRWYAGKLNREQRIGKREREMAHNLSDAFAEDLDEFFRSSTLLCADMVRALAIGGEDGGQMFHKSGFGELLAEPEFQDQTLRHHFGDLMDSIDQEMKTLIARADFDAPRIFVGSENPIEDAKEYSMIIKTVRLRRGRGVFAVLGAKRMRYDKALSFLAALEEIIDL